MLPRGPWRTWRSWASWWTSCFQSSTWRRRPYVPGRWTCRCSLAPAGTPPCHRVRSAWCRYPRNHLPQLQKPDLWKTVIQENLAIQTIMLLHLFAVVFDRWAKLFLNTLHIEGTTSCRFAIEIHHSAKQFTDPSSQTRHLAKTFDNLQNSST